jgi:hypothetical protein
MGLLDAADALVALFSGEAGEKARRGGLLLAAVLLANRPQMLNIVIDGQGGA